MPYTIEMGSAGIETNPLSESHNNYSDEQPHIRMDDPYRLVFYITIWRYAENPFHHMKLIYIDVIEIYRVQEVP